MPERSMTRFQARRVIRERILLEIATRLTEVPDGRLDPLVEELWTDTVNGIGRTVARAYGLTYPAKWTGGPDA